MLLSELKRHLKSLDHVTFRQPNGKNVPAHFHITEVGHAEKNFIDCGGTVRKTESIRLQLWSANDLLHRLKPQKLLDIIELSEKKLGLPDQEVEVEYQTPDTLGIYHLDFDGENFHLKSLSTDCLAKELCNIPQVVKQSVGTVISSCTPGSGCC